MAQNYHQKQSARTQFSETKDEREEVRAFGRQEGLEMKPAHVKDTTYHHSGWVSQYVEKTGELSKAIVLNTKLNKVFKLARNRIFRSSAQKYFTGFIRTLCCSTQPHLYANESCLKSWGKAFSS